MAEFLNRIDETVLFDRLSRDNMRSIVDIQLVDVERLLRERHVGLEVTDEARVLLANEGYDIVYGARPLAKVIRQRVLNPLAKKILNGEVLSDARVMLSVEDGALRIGVVNKGDDGVEDAEIVAED